MIENIRKYTGLMIVVLVLLFVGLVFLGDGVKNSFGSKPVMEVAGKSISQKEFDRNMAVLDLPSSLSFSPLPRETRVLASHYLGDSVIDYEQMSAGAIVSQMSHFLQPSRDAPDRFVTNRINIQKAGIEYGVTPSNNEVESFVENVLFADAEGNYDLEAYNDFIKNRVTNLGGTKGFNEYVKDLLTAQNLSRLLGGGIAPEMETVTSLYENQKQVITAEQIVIEPSSYEAKVIPTEDQLKEFYEENKANYNSEELRSVSYIHIQPDWEATLKKVNEDKAKAAKAAEEARKKAEAEAKKANEANKPAMPDPKPAEKTTPAETSTEASTPEAMAPPKPAVVEAIPVKAQELVTKLRAMAVYFDSASDAIKASEEEKINEAAKLILDSKDVENGLTVGGYADLQGNADFNRDLSLKRANAVRDRLIAKGIPADRLTVNHFGEDTSKSAKEDLWKSRRVEISLTKKKPVESGSEGDPGEPGEQAPAPTQTPVQPTKADQPILVQPTATPTPGAPNAQTSSPAKPAPPKSAEEQLDTAEKNKAVVALTPTVSEFFQKLADNFGKDFEAIATESGYTVTKTEFFEKSSPPKELAKGIQESNVGSLANAVFLLPSNGDSDEKLSDPYKTNNGWFIIRLDEVQASVPLSYEEAKVRVTVDLKKKLAREMMVEEAKALHERLTAALKEGKTFEEAAKAAEQPVEKKSNLVAGQSYQGRFFGDPAFEPAKSTNPGEIAPLELTPSEEAPDQALIIYVDKREIVKDEQYSTQLDRTFSGLSDASRLVAFENWLNDRYKESEVVPPNLGEQR